MKMKGKVHHIKDIFDSKDKGYIIVLAECDYGKKVKLGDELPKFKLDEWDKVTCKRCLKYMNRKFKVVDLNQVYLLDGVKK